MCQSLFFNKVVELACNFIKKETLALVLSCGFCEISKNTFCYKTPPACNFVLKKRLWHRCVPVNLTKFLRTPFVTQHLRPATLLKKRLCTGVFL